MLAEGLEETDTAGRWMAHHLADLLDRAEGAGSTPKDVRRVEKLVIKLWNHKAALPMQDPPLSSFKPILRALERMDPRRPPWHYYGRTPEVDDTVPGNVDIQLAMSLDRVAGDLIRFFLEEASRKVAVAEGGWVDASEQVAEQDNSVVGRFIREMKPKKTPAQYLDDRIVLMEVASAICAAAKEELTIRRSELDPPLQQ